MPVLEMRLVDGTGVENSGLGDLRGALNVALIVRGAGQRGGVEATVGLIVIQPRIAEGERVVGVELIIDARAQGGARLRSGQKLADTVGDQRIIRQRRQSLLQRRIEQNVVVVNITPFEIEKERSFLAQWSAHVAAVLHGGEVRRLRRLQERIARIEEHLAGVEEHRTVE